MERLTREKGRIKPINALIYGRPGEGKTTLAATACYHEALRDVLWLDQEGGVLSIVEGLSDLKPEYFPFHRPVANVADIEEVFWAIIRKSEEFQTIRTIVIDTITDLQNVDMEREIRAKIKVDERRKDGDPDDPYPDDYGHVGRRISRVLRWFRDAPINVIFIAHTEEIFAKQPGFAKIADSQQIATEITIGLTPMARRRVLGFMDFVWLLKSKDGERALLTQPRPPFYAKTRGPDFAERIGAVIPWSDIKQPLFAQIYDCLIDPTKKLTKETK